MEAVVLVTGASGFLGDRVCQALVEHGGYRVKALVRRTSDLHTLPSAVEVVYGDLTDAPSLLRACTGCHALFHCAALVGAWSPHPSDFITVNVDGLRNLIEAIKGTPSIEVVVYVSSFFALGPSNGSLADETQIHPGVSFCSEYEKSKVMADKVARQAAEEGLPIVLVYPGFLYGPGKLTEGNSLIELLALHCHRILPCHMGNGKDKLSFCHVDDVARGCIAAMEKGKKGERYLLTGENASFDQMLDIVDSCQGVPSSFLRAPLWVLEIVGRILVLWSRLTGNPPLISYPMVHILRKQWAYSHEKAKKELGYNPRPLQEGISELLYWMKSTGKL